METIAIPIYGTRISNRFDCSRDVLVVFVEDGTVRKREIYHWASANSLEKIEILVQLGANVLICDGITEFNANQLGSTPVQVIPWISGEAEEVLSKYLEGKSAGGKFSIEDG